MEMRQTLASMFEANKQALEKELSVLVLPRDVLKIQQVVNDFFYDLFERDGEYRLSLNQSEDYILLSALQLLQSQQNMTSEISGWADKWGQDFTKQKECRNNSIVPIVGAGVGALTGSTIGSWAAVFGSIAGTIIAVYYSSVYLKRKRLPEQTKYVTIDVEQFCSIIQKICTNIDDLIETYRVQVKRIENIYLQIDKPSFMTEYSSLVEHIENVYNHVLKSKELLPQQVLTSVEMLIQALENYNIFVVNGRLINGK